MNNTKKAKSKTKLGPVLFLLAIILLLVLTLSHPLFSQAQGCGGILGSNVAANWDRRNLELIRNNAGCSGPIPIEVIITDPNNTALLLELQNNLKELNFVPTWRPWGNGMPQGNELQSWINAASVLTIGQFQLFSEPNNCYYGCFSGSSPNPVADAAAALAFLEASQRGEIKIPLALMPLSPRTPDGGNFLSEQHYWTEFNNACGGCVKNFDYIGLNIYPQTTPGLDPSENVNKFINDFNAQVNFFAGLGVNLGTTRFIITEAGLDPGSYTNFQQRVNDTIAFAQALEARIAADPSLFINIDQIAFFLSDENGKQYLIYRQCDAAGNCQWIVEGFPFYNPNVPSLPKVILNCTPTNSGDKYSRPVPCDSCNETNLLTGSCATTFTVNDEVHYAYDDVDFWCPAENPKPWLERSWSGNIGIDFSNTTIPFVGKREGEDEQKYLADYLEGTNEYYQNYSLYWKEWIDHAGVWRKLAPMEYQDKFKEQMVTRAVNSVTGNLTTREGAIHDYQLNYTGRICWDMPFLIDALLAFAQRYHIPIPIINDLLDATYHRAHYCVFDEIPIRAAWLAITAFNAALPLDILDIKMYRTTDETATLTALDGHFPPKSDEENYIKKWEDWKKSKWGKLWEVVPMFSREDTPGQILPFLGSRPKDTFEITNPEAQIEKVPHLARLYEIGRELKKVLFPLVPVESEQSVLGEKLLIAQAGSSLSIDFSIFLSSLGGNQYSLCWSVSGQASGGCNFCDWGYCIQPYGFCEPILPKHCFSGNPTLTCNMGSAHPITITANPGDTVCATLNITNGVCVGPCCDPDPRGGFTQTSCCKILEDGTPTCGTGPAPEPPTCGLPPPIPVDSCEKTAITDPNPNDNLCCQEPIKIFLSATDTFENPHYDECQQDPAKCSKIAGRKVSREVGVSLLHPYLSQIWSETTDKLTGFFNIFRPGTVPEFEPIDAASQINYSYSPGSAEPSTGRFYFPYLGGVQLAKEWLNKTLTPKGE